MNAYEQLHQIRDRLEERDAGPETIRLVDRAIAMAEPEKDNPLSISQSMMLRHLLKMANATSNYYIQNDLEGLLEDRPTRHEDDAPDATVDSERRPQHTHNYYRKMRERSQA